MKKIISLAALLIVQIFFANPLDLSAQTKEIAVTIDDLPLNGQQFDQARLRVMTDKFLAGLVKFQIPAVGFVNESLLYQPNETDARIGILKKWSAAGVELGNHNFSHLGFKDATLADYQDDFVRGAAVTRMILKQKGAKPRYFRHPFLQMGATLETEKAFENFIAERGYKIAPVTIDTMDWMFLNAYAKARAENNRAMMKRVSDEYLKYVGIKIDYCEKVAGDLFGQPIKQILLLHANAIDDKTGKFRTDSFWYQKLGSDYIQMAFEFAREADPNAKLYYNDYSAERMNVKADGVYTLLRELKKNGVPVDGIGWQMHEVDGFHIEAQHRENAKRLAALGLELSITEMDVRLKLPASAADLRRQADAYRDVAEFCLAEKSCKAVLIWGFTDKYSWIPGEFPDTGDALIFDKSYQPKLAYTALLESFEQKGDDKK